MTKINFIPLIDKVFVESSTAEEKFESNCKTLNSDLL